jgi:hypothetical protein
MQKQVADVQTSFPVQGRFPFASVLVRSRRHSTHRCPHTASPRPHLRAALRHSGARHLQLPAQRIQQRSLVLQLLLVGRRARHGGHLRIEGRKRAGQVVAGTGRRAQCSPGQAVAGTGRPAVQCRRLNARRASAGGPRARRHRPSVFLSTGIRTGPPRSFFGRCEEQTAHLRVRVSQVRVERVMR